MANVILGTILGTLCGYICGRLVGYVKARSKSGADKSAAGSVLEVSREQLSAVRTAIEDASRYNAESAEIIKKMHDILERHSNSADSSSGSTDSEKVAASNSTDSSSGSTDSEKVAASNDASSSDSEKVAASNDASSSDSEKVDGDTQ